MPRSKDFRQFAFDLTRVDAAGRAVAQAAFWKLYAIENMVRVLIHSILSVQYPPPDWWPAVSTPAMQANAARRRADYGKHPWHTKPGVHDVYFILLSELTEIIVIARHVLLPVIPSIDSWTTKLKDIR